MKLRVTVIVNMLIRCVSQNKISRNSVFKTKRNKTSKFKNYGLVKYKNDRLTKCKEGG